MQTLSLNGLTPAELGAWRGLLRVHAQLVRELDRELQEEHGLPLHAYEVLLVLERSPGARLRMSELADAVLLSQSGLTRLVDRLARDGLVERSRCADDRRGLLAHLTAAGRARLAQARPTHLRGVRERFLAHLDETTLRELAAVWERVLPGAASE
ncbi:Transcriptional regulator [Gaiella occulta]|uniref:Transcriptional regulator n=1 Tax=Gaiella occulta TaxID=1002870 RepID=A0A7M2Z0K6_9ACTN|nr:MarR family transcriptional regulator [Gaiella occulta]RDI75946.1 Transcriptional regulator [Gaiella occulta]